MANKNDDEEDAPTGRSKVGGFKRALNILSWFSLIVFIIVAAAKGITEKSNPDNAFAKASWGLVVIPLVVWFFSSLLWFVVNYFSTGVIAASFSGEQGSQYFYNLLGQLLVKEVEVSAIENINEAIMLRHILRSVWYGLIIAYSFSLTQLSCACSIPYKMIAFGFIFTYAARLFMLLFNGFYDYHRYHDMATEVRTYQESLDHTRLFEVAVPHLNAASSRPLATGVDLFLWVVTMAFAGLGTMWMINHSCQSSCPAMFHVYSFLLLSIFIAEGLSLFAKFALLYYERTQSIEGLDRLMAMIMEHNKRMQLVDPAI